MHFLKFSQLLTQVPIFGFQFFSIGESENPQGLDDKTYCVTSINQLDLQYMRPESDETGVKNPFELDTAIDSVQRASAAACVRHCQGRRTPMPRFNAYCLRSCILTSGA